ncbi:MAG: precorrin-6Y C5,15-methyltransferase (decarboxylating) subunit CbiT, partial [Silicimonas sp.]|nr:precorrin-6Y C5,15-methyltransferase (decarboxylating) subunit CbiT [Silicimonas sp.]
LDFDDAQHPVVVAFEVVGAGPFLSAASGRPDDLFTHDGQITKQPVRALTLSALAPRPGERLWDIGAGSGSIALEWLYCAPEMAATAFERRADRAAVIAGNAERLGLADREFQVVPGEVPEALVGHPKPQAVFVGGGLGPDLLAWLEANLVAGTRVVANAVTLETQGLVSEAASRLGGSLLKIDLSEAEPLGGFRSWRPARTLVQWSVTL